MNNFSFHNPTRIHFGRGQIGRLTQEIPRDAKVLITYGGGSIKNNGVLDQVHRALTDHRVLEFGGIEPNPSYETLMEAVKLARAENIDFLLAVGGGSVVDGTKFIAAAIDFEGDPWTILSDKDSIDTATPFGCVLTLPATGSESNPNAVISRKSTQDKLSFGHPLVYPVFAIMDPETTFSLPERQTANGIVDTWIHITEQYLTCRDSSKVQDRYAEGLLITLVESGSEVMKQPDNYDARATIMWAANQALYGLVGVGIPHDWASHSIGHEITALYGLDHAQTLAVVHPALLHVMADQKGPKLLQYAERVWGIREGSDNERIAQAIEKTRGFFESLGVQSRLSDYGIGEGAITTVTDQLKRHGRLTLGERGNITPEVVATILRQAL